MSDRAEEDDFEAVVILGYPPDVRRQSSGIQNVIWPNTLASDE